MKKILPSLVLLLLSSTAALAQQHPGAAPQASTQQQAAPPQPKLIEVDSIQVTTTIEPLPLAESDRSVDVIAPRDLPIGTDSAVDLLRADPSLNVQARAAEGVQADLSIRGTTFEQSLVLVNGLRVNDPETGPLTLDIPVPLDVVTRIDRYFARYTGVRTFIDRTLAQTRKDGSVRT